MMTRNEAVRVIKMMLEVDGQCIVCAGHLLRDFIIEFPQFEDLAREMYREEYDGEI